MPVRDLLFDLDGTLIDSAPPILDTFAAVLAAHGRTPVVEVDRTVIGPPLRLTLERLSGAADPALLDAMATTFRERYDVDGVAATVGYPGLRDVLDTLGTSGRRSFVVTNKRILPARRILDRLGVAAAFTGVHALDAIEPRAPDKGTLTAHVLAAHAIEPAHALFIGDSTDDAIAAARHGIRFAAAAYGYGEAATQREAPVHAVLARLTDLPALLAALDPG